MVRRQKTPDIAPINAPWPMVEEWLGQWPFDTRSLRDDVAWSPVFTAQSFTPGRTELDERWTTGGEVSWLGGPAVLPLPEWPRRTDGIALAHVATVAVPDVAGAAWSQEKEAFPDHREGLPTTGVLEVFHDLETYGFEAANGSAGGWLVRWVPEPDRSGFAEVPSDVDTPTEVAQPGLFLRGWTLRSPSEFIGTRHFEAAEALGEAYQRAWLLQHTGSADGWPVPVTHVYGHSQAGSAEALEVLADVLPLEAGDSHRLVMDIESWTHLDQWFGDAAPLEVWMRESDLAARRFDRAWCMIRTG